MLTNMVIPRNNIDCVVLFILSYMTNIVLIILSNCLGDPLRVNQHLGIAVTSTSLLRLHNVLCDELREINPSWDDERTYQEARRILIGMYQHVTYNEYIPIILGKL